MTKELEQLQELSADTMDKIAGGVSMDIRTPMIPVDCDSQNSVRVNYLSGLVSDALQGNGSINAVLALCKNEQERSYVRQLVASRKKA